MVRVVGVKNLGLVLQPAKGLGVDNAVTISLILGSIGMGFLRIAPPFRHLISHGERGQPHVNDYILARIMHRNFGDSPRNFSARSLKIHGRDDSWIFTGSRHSHLQCLDHSGVCPRHVQPLSGVWNTQRQKADPMPKLRSSNGFLKQSLLNPSCPLKIDFLLVQ